MKITKTPLLSILFVLQISGKISAQEIVIRDPIISTFIGQISSDTLSAYVNKLVTFGTRSTLSNTTDPKTGIGASRKWVLDKFLELRFPVFLLSFVLIVFGGMMYLVYKKLK